LTIFDIRVVISISVTGLLSLSPIRGQILTLLQNWRLSAWWQN